MKISKAIAGHYNWGQNCDGWHLMKTDDMSVIHERMPAHTSEIRHYHSKSAQFFFVLSGEAVMELEGEQIRLYRHEGLEIKPGQPHQMNNCTDEEIEFIVISSPPSHGDRFNT